MHLYISLGESSVNELKFDRGPIYIGRQMGSQVFLPDKSVSRQHAVLYTTKDGDWVIEDLGSSNKTYLNSQAVHKCELAHNDVVRVADFLIRVSLQESEEQPASAEMEDTLVGDSPMHRNLHTVERNLDASDAPPVKFPAKRIKCFHEAIEIMNRQTTQEKLFQNLSDLLFRQMKAMNIWMAFRKDPTGPMDIQLGRKLNTEHIERTDLAIPASLAETLVRNKYLLVHQMPRQITNRGIRSVLIAPIMADKDNHGVIYIENSTEHTHYSLPDLDYLILITIHAAHLIRKL